MSRELRIVYGSTTVGQGTAREITGYSINTKKFAEWSIEFEFWIAPQTTDAGFSNEIADVENAFRKPFQDLTVSNGPAGGSTSSWYSFSQSGNTGLDAMPEITKREDGATARTRKYGVKITLGLPANTSAEIVSGLREYRLEVAYDSSRIRTVTLSGVFTAVPGTNARAQYTAQIGALETNAFALISLTASNRELVEEPQADGSYNDKTITFRRVYRELIFSQGGASNDDPAIVLQRLIIDRSKDAPGDTPGTTRLATLNVSFDCHIDQTVTKDIRGKYSSVLAWIMQQVQATLASGPLALIKDDPAFNYDLNIISAKLIVQGVFGGDVLKREIEIDDDMQSGQVLVPIWTGDRFSKYKYDGPATLRRTITDTVTYRGFLYFQANASGAGTGGGPPQEVPVATPVIQGLSAIHVQDRPKIIHRRLGIPNTSYTIDVTDVVRVDLYEFYKPYKPKRSERPPVPSHEFLGGKIVNPAGAPEATK